MQFLHKLAKDDFSVRAADGVPSGQSAASGTAAGDREGARLAEQLAEAQLAEADTCSRLT
jgi:hypothetical protein